MEDDVSSRTYAQSLRTFVPNAAHQLMIQDAVHRMHRIKLLSSEFFTLHINRCLDDGLALPVVDQVWVYQLFKQASHVGDKETRSSSSNPPSFNDKDASIEATVAFLEKGRTFDRPSRISLSQILSAEANLLVATFQTNISAHYRDRVHRYVRWTFKPDFKLPHDEHVRLKTEMAQVVTDVCRHGEETYTSPDVYHAWIEQYRIFFGLDRLLAKESLRYVLTTQPHRFLPSMRLMSRAFEFSGKKTFSLVPLTTSSRPGFVQFDVRSAGDVLHLGMMESRKAKQKETASRTKQEKQDGTYMSKAEKKAAMVVEKEAREEMAHKARETQRLADKLLNKQELSVT